jgi:hypothetical protein
MSNYVNLLFRFGLNVFCHPEGIHGRGSVSQ